jgi:hypothetical protein
VRDDCIRRMHADRFIVPSQQSNIWRGREGQRRRGHRRMGLLRSWHFLSFSSDAVAYYTTLQTIAGGSGAGPTWHGTSGVHTHITNTRIGDVEILERRYPVLLRQFGIREGSGGSGKWLGGSGAVRDIEFLERLQVSILSEVSLLNCQLTRSDTC